MEHGLSRAALAAARALAAGGWEVGIGAPRLDTLASASKAARRAHWVPTPQQDPARFAAGIRDAVDEAGYEVVFAADDAELMALSALRVGIPAIVPYADHEIVLRALDKIELTRAAEAVGLRCPRTAVADADALAAVSGPTVVKGRLHAGVGPGAGARQDATIARDAASATRRAAEIEASGGEAILQEVIEGNLMALSCLAGPGGELLAAVQQESSLTWPPRSGVTVRGRTVALEPALVEGARRLMSELGWLGIAELQFVRPPEGEPRLIDLNGRFYGSLGLAVASGPNLPAAWAALATQRPVPELPAPRAGVRYQWLEGDLRRAARERRGGLARDVAGCARYAIGATHSIAHVRDPGPALRLVRLLGARGVRRLRD